MRKVLLCLLLTVAVTGNVSALTKYTYQMTEGHLRQLIQDPSTSPYISPTISCDSSKALDSSSDLAEYVIGTTPGNEKYNPAFPNTSSLNDCPPHNIYAYKISDPCSPGPKVNIIIMTGIHGSESSGTWTCHGMIDFCAGNEPVAIHLRKIANCYVYPDANPDGRYLGNRGNPELKRMIDDGMLPANTTNDMNRVWHLNGWGLSTIDTLIPAMLMDTGGKAEYFFDYHGGSSQGASWFYCDPSLYDHPFAVEFEALKQWVPGEPRPVEHTNVERPGDYRMTRIWAMRADTLNATFGATPENTGQGTPQDRFDLGRAYGLGVHNALTQGDPWHDYNKLKVNSENWLSNNLVPRQEGQLLAQWKFDEGSGSIAADSSGNGYNCTITGAAWVNDSTMGKVLDFEGIDYVSVPTSAFSSITDQVTISLWQYGDTAKQPQQDSCFYGVNSSGTRVFNAHIPWSDGKIVWDAGCLGTSYDRINVAADSASQYEGRWNHWVFTKNTSTGMMNIYYNGALWQSASGKIMPITGITQFKIGSRNTGTSYNYDGMICDFRIYNYELLPDEIQQIYEDENIILPTPGQQFICEQIPAGDLNEDCMVNYLDFAILASTWLEKPIIEEGILRKQYFSDNVSTYEFTDATWSHNLGGGVNRILIVALAQEDDNIDDMDVASITFNRVEMHPVVNSQIDAESSDTIKLSYYYLLEHELPQPGFYPISVTYTDSVVQRLGGSISRSNVAQQQPICIATNSNSSQDTISTQAITVSDNAWIIDTVVCDQRGSFTPTSAGMTEHWDVSGDDGNTTLAGSSKETLGQTTMSWNYNSGANMMIHSVIECELIE